MKVCKSIHVSATIETLCSLMYKKEKVIRMTGHLEAVNSASDGLMCAYR
jgi:hypothetical protein